MKISKNQRVSVVGLGIMGTPIAINLKKAGFQVGVYNRTQEKVHPLLAEGIRAYESMQDLVLNSDIIILMLTGPEAISDLMNAKTLSQLKESQIVVNMSSVSPMASIALSQKITRTKALYIEAPVSGSKKPAEDGQLVILAGGNKSLIENLQPIFQPLSKKVVYCGEVGQGAMMKMAINMLLASAMAGLCEMLEFGKKGGLSFQTVMDVVQSGPLSCGLYNLKSTLLETEEFTPQFPLKHMTKDLKFALDTCHETGAYVPVTAQLYTLFRRAQEQGWGDADFSAVLKVLKP